MPNKAMISLQLAILMATAAGCSRSESVDKNQVAEPANIAVPTDLDTANGAAAKASTDADYTNAPLEIPQPGEPGALPDDRTPISEAPAAAGSPQAAATVVETYFALLGQKRFDEASRLWQGNTPDLAAQYANYIRIGANIGAPGKAEPGAGQVYVQVPVQVYGRLKDGTVVNGLGEATLHRINGQIDGATDDDKRWRITEIDAKPVPYVKPAGK